MSKIALSYFGYTSQGASLVIKSCNIPVDENKLCYGLVFYLLSIDNDFVTEFTYDYLYILFRCIKTRVNS